MTKEERIATYDKATELWGLVAQYDQCVEEMAELTVAINKYKRKVLYNETYLNKDKIVENMVEEIADVSICIEQMQHFFKEFGFEEMLNKKMAKFQSQIEIMENQKK